MGRSTDQGTNQDRDQGIIEFRDMPLTAEIADILFALGEVAARLAHDISLGALASDHGALVGENADGDGQKALDLIADDAFMKRLKTTGVKFYASEEQEEAITLNEAGEYALAIDPLDGSSNINANVSIGTIFSIRPAGKSAEASFLQAGSAQLAAGYFVYGPQTALVMSTGQGTHQFILDRSKGQFRHAGPMIIPAKTREFAINASNHRHWSKPVRAYVDDCLEGVEGPRGENFNMRWIASLVAETHRILSRGGIFLYPRDDREGYEAGRLRMIYECAPIAMLIEQAQGMAIDAGEPILDQSAGTLHGRTPFIFGSREEVERVRNYHDLPESEISPLFRNRGLFSV